MARRGWTLMVGWLAGGVAMSVLLSELELAEGQVRYQPAPPAIRAILDTPAPPALSVSPTREHVLLLDTTRYPPIRELAAPLLRLAGHRINPRTNGPHEQPHLVGMKLLALPAGTATVLKLPPQPRLTAPLWSPNGKSFAFTNTTEDRIELWLGDAQTGTLRHLPEVRVNAAYSEPLHWLPDGQTLLCKALPRERGAPPVDARVPLGPQVQESAGKPAPVRTFQDLLRSAHDEDLFDYYATSQLALIDTANGEMRPLGKPGVIALASPSPDGKYLLVSRHVRPYSYLFPSSSFPREVEVWDMTGQVVFKLASLPLADQVPIEGVPTGPRLYHWRPTEPATLSWVTALDGGDPRKKVSHRDGLVLLGAPFQAQTIMWAKTEHRFAGLWYGEERGLTFVRDYDRERRWQRTEMFRQQPGVGLVRQEVWSHSIHDHYREPGTFVTRMLPNGHRVVRLHEGKVLLAGQGATPQGDRPFLDRMVLQTLKAERLWQCPADRFEQTLAVLSDDGRTVLAHTESPTEPPNVEWRQLEPTGKIAAKRLTHYTDPAPQLRQIKKELVTYKRPDGVTLSFTLYLPPDYKQGEKRPAVVWAYPREYVDTATAGQVTGSSQRFTTLSGSSHLFFLLAGYVVLDNATMPVVGDPETVNNTYVEQIVASAKACLDKADAMGAIDRSRVGVGGHSYGAFMTANLLAHCDFFKAGIARSGAYNRTLTPFGFQSERRTLWEAPQVYMHLSPFMHAHKIKQPLLLLHGEMDNNPGTFPLQSERMYHAVKGNGGTARLVMLPYESHGYVARESIEHTLYEMIGWFDRHVKNAGPVKEGR